VIEMATFYRLCRTWHGYLSALAFVWLLFFSITGILLNHPDWLSRGGPAVRNGAFQLDPAQIDAVRHAAEPGAALVTLLRSRVALIGDVDSSDKLGDMMFVRLKGARGSSDLRVDLRTGSGTSAVESLPALALFKELHRGGQAGPVWRALIDIMGGILTASSVIGLLIFFCLRLRLRSALLLVGAGLGMMVAAVFLFVP
jgi:hypothetical protein